MDDDRMTQSDANIVNLHRFATGRGLTPLNQTEAYWSALRVDGAIPNRSQIDPRGLENVLEYAFVLERIAPGIARFRLAGQHLRTLAGTEIRGMPLTALFAGPSRREISAILEHVFDTPAVADIMLRNKGKFARPSPSARMMLLPLRSDQGDISRALGVLVADDVKAHAGLHLSVTDKILRPVSGYQHDAQPVAADVEQVKPNARAKSHLRLV